MTPGGLCTSFRKFSEPHLLLACVFATICIVEKRRADDPACEQRVDAQNRFGMKIGDRKVYGNERLKWQGSNRSLITTSSASSWSIGSTWSGTTEEYAAVHVQAGVRVSRRRREEVFLRADVQDDAHRRRVRRAEGAPQSHAGRFPHGSPVALLPRGGVTNAQRIAALTKESAVKRDTKAPARIGF